MWETIVVTGVTNKYNYKIGEIIMSQQHYEPEFKKKLVRLHFGTVKISRVFKLTKLFMVPMLPEVEPPATAYT